nr:reverse transcriptase domain-containing protein [Tanacetum cinerariifolium]
MSYKEPPIPPTGVNQQEPVDATKDTEPQNSDDIHPPTVQAEDDILAAKFMEIFRDLHFELSFADALIHMSKFAPMFKKLLNNKDKLIELTKTPLNENYLAVVLKKLPEKLADFVILDFVVDPRVPLILGRPFLSTAHAIINVFEREIIIRQNQQSLTIQCSDIPSVKKIEQINKIEFINVGRIDSESEEIEDFLNDESIQFRVEDSPFNMDKDILFLESLLRDDPIPPHPIIPNQTKLPIEETNHSLKMGPSITIHILEEERTKMDHADYIKRMEMLFTINPRPHNPTNNNINVESFSSFQIPNQENEPRQEEIDIVSETNDVLP